MKVPKIDDYENLLLLIILLDIKKRERSCLTFSVVFIKINFIDLIKNSFKRMYKLSKLPINLEI